MNELLSDAHSWALILGVLNTVVVAVINRPQWPAWLRQVVAVVMAVLLGVVDALANGVIHDGTTVLQVIAMVLVASEVAYRTVMSKIAGAIERETSPTNDHRVIDGEVTHVSIELEPGRSPHDLYRLARQDLEDWYRKYAL